MREEESEKVKDTWKNSSDLKKKVLDLRVDEKSQEWKLFWDQEDFLCPKRRELDSGREY